MKEPSQKPKGELCEDVCDRKQPMKGVNTQVFEVQTRKLIEYVRRRAMEQSESSDSPGVMRYRKHVKKAYGTKRSNQEVTSILGGKKKRRRRRRETREKKDIEGWICNDELKNI